jgi:hypothetical protein
MEIECHELKKEESMSKIGVLGLHSWFVLAVGSVGVGGCASAGDQDMATSGEQAQALTADARIVGGSNTDITKVPWQVAVNKNGGHWCGGSIIADRWILTAAHCVSGQPMSSLQVVAGITKFSDTTGQKRSVSSIHVFPGYVDATLGKDAALLELSSALDLSGNKARAIAVATLVDAESFDPNQLGLVSGWGTLSFGGPLPDTLQSVRVPIVPLPVAEAAYGELTSDQLAAGAMGVGGIDSCQGDSGGPLVVDSPRGPLLAGTVSWGEGCAEPDYPGMYGRVASFADWIAQTMQTNRHIQWIIDTNRDGTTDIRVDYGMAFDRPIPGDYNGDGKTDFGLLRQDGDQWQWIIDTNRDGTTDLRVNYGLATDFPVPADYDGDGKADFAVVRADGSQWQWIIDTNRDGTTDLRKNYGNNTDRVVPADYNGDGKADFGLLRVDGGQWQWIIDTNRDGTTDLRKNYGNNTDRVVPADYDGDGKADFGLLRVDGSQWQWIIDTNRDGTTDLRRNYGNNTDGTVPADYDGDGKADFGLLRVDGDQWQWIIDTNRDGTTDLRTNYGLRTDATRGGDYDGDGKTDFTLIRVVP